jgi:hypothetical protein
MPGEPPLVGSNSGEDASHNTGYVRGLSLLILIVLSMIEDIVLLLLVSILHGVIQGEDVVLLLVVLLFIEAFQ